MQQAPLVLVFCRYPRPGEVKTRLAAGPAGLDAAQACALYSAFVTDVLASLREAGARCVVCTAPNAPLAAYRAWLGPQFEFLQQQGADLGQRMATAFAKAFAAGAHKALLVGTDVPQLPPGVIRQAWRELDRRPVVLGPAMDGGYYLIGMRRGAVAPELFQGVSWSTRHVLQQTLARLPRGVHAALLPRLRDCDTLEDLRSILQQAPLERARTTRRQARVFGLV